MKRTNLLKLSVFLALFNFNQKSHADIRLTIRSNQNDDLKFISKVIEDKNLRETTDLILLSEEDDRLTIQTNTGKELEDFLQLIQSVLGDDINIEEVESSDIPLGTQGIGVR